MTTSMSAAIQADADARRRFEAKHHRNANGCWVWDAKSEDKDGYGQFRSKKVLYRAHRFAWLLYRGDIEAGMDVDHICPGEPNRRCVNPEHLEVISHAENMRRQRGRRAVVPPWNVQESPAPTSPELVMGWVEDLVARYECEGPMEHLAIGGIDGSPWRQHKLDFDKGFLEVRDKFALAALYLYAVGMGVDARLAAVRILKVSPITVHSWNKNVAWKEDMSAARREGRKQRYRDLESKIVDTLEARIPAGDLKDVVNALTAVNKREAMLKPRAKEQVQLPSGNTYIFQVSAAANDIAGAMEYIYTATARDVAALPGPSEQEGDEDE